MFQHDMSPPSWGDRANTIKAEFDYKSPKLRLSVFAYLVENDRELNVDVIDSIVTYISGGVDEYTGMIEKLQNADRPDTIIEDGKNPYEQGGYA